LLVEAYAALWIILMAWLVLVWKKQNATDERIAGLEKAIRRADDERDDRMQDTVAARPKEPDRSQNR
jgi:hypothetical protein